MAQINHLYILEDIWFTACIACRGLVYAVEVKMLKRLFQDETGQDLIEYGLLIGIITAGAILAIQQIGPKVKTYFTDLNTQIP
jgi:Flp pilus assembly pilin Flp